jgi:hypothetical protein
LLLRRKEERTSLGGLVLLGQPLVKVDQAFLNQALQQDLLGHIILLELKASVGDVCKRSQVIIKFKDLCFARELLEHDVDFSDRNLHNFHVHRR